MMEVQVDEIKHSGGSDASAAAVAARRRTRISRISVVAQREVPRVLIDTDAGLDDAAAIFMVLEAHKQGRINVAAITTTHGNTTLHNVNKNVLRLLQTVDMLHIPVFSGAVSPLVQPYLEAGPAPFHGHDGFGDTNLPHPDLSKLLQRKPAAVKIVEEAQYNKGRLRILALGPLSNIALAKRMEPKLLCQLASLHIMGGNTTGEGNFSPCGEFNFRCDPEAAQIVLSTDRLTGEAGSGGGGGGEVHEPCTVYLTPWETCLRAIQIPYSYRQELGEEITMQASLLNMGEAALLARKTYEDYVTCDQLAAAWMLDTLLGDSMASEDEDWVYSPLATEAVECRVTVELQGIHTRGQMVLDRLNRISYSLPTILLTGVNEDTYRRYLGTAFGRAF